MPGYRPTRRTVIRGTIAAALAAGWPESLPAIQASATPVAVAPPTPGWAELGLMQGFPPPPDLTVTRANWIAEPYVRWAAQHGRELFPTSAVPTIPDASDQFPSAPCSLDTMTVSDDTGQPLNLSQILELTQTDAFLVLKDGVIVDERYFNSMTPETPHILASQTKALVGVIAADLATGGTIDLNAAAKDWVPELSGNPFGEATLVELLDMQVPVTYPGIDPVLGIFWASNTLERPPDYAGPETIYDFILAAKSTGPPGSVFQYENGCTETVGWVMRRATGQRLSELFSSRLWQPMGANAAAAFILDPIGAEVASGGFIATARDVARFGENLRASGKTGATRVLSPDVMSALEAGASAAAPHARNLFAASDYEATAPGFSYRLGWWLPNDPNGSLEARGLFGQRLFVAPWAGVTIVQFSSQVGAIRYDRLMERLFQQIASTLAEIA